MARLPRVGVIATVTVIQILSSGILRMICWSDGINVHVQSPRIDTGGYRAVSRIPSPGDAEIASNAPNAKHYIYVREAVEAKEQSWFSFTTRYVQG